MLKSFLQFLNTKYLQPLDDVIDLLGNIIERDYPPVLLLVNLNGSFVYRTRERINSVYYVEM